MKMMDHLVPVFAAIIGAIALLLGYAYQKGKEGDAEVLKQRQEIYARLITNITTRNSVLGHIEQSPAYIEASTAERSAIYSKDPDFIQNRAERTQIVALLCLYGTDDAIKAYAEYSAKAIGPNQQIDDVGELIVALRRSLLDNRERRRTTVTAREANLGIWWATKFLPDQVATR